MKQKEKENESETKKKWIRKSEWKEKGAKVTVREDLRKN